MDASVASLVDARNNMVDGQVRPNKVTDRRILDAMRWLPREQFVPPGTRSMAYADTEVPIGHGRFLLEPMVLARLIQGAELPAAATVLVIGAGYAAAVLAAAGATVTVVEQDPALIDQANLAYAMCGLQVPTVQGALAAGWPAAAPYDCILIDGAVRELPPLAGQLRAEPPGRLCAVLVASGRRGTAVVAEPAGKGLAHRPLFDCAATVMPQSELASGFTF